MEGSSEDDGSLAAILERSRRPGRRVRIVVAMLAVVLMANIAALYLTRMAPPAPPPPPVELPSSPTPYPTLVKLLGSGQFNLTLPLMTAHNPDNASVPNVTFENWVSFSSGYNGISAINYTWANITGTSLPVRFLVDPAEIGYIAGAGWFVWHPGGSCDENRGCKMRESHGAVTPNVTLVVYNQVYLEYNVYEVTLAPPLSSLSWIDVIYSLGTVSSGGQYVGDWCPLQCGQLPSEPSFTELKPVGAPLDIRVDPVSPYRYDYDVHDFVDSSEVFNARLPAQAFNAGSYGVIQAQLVSSFSWEPASEGSFRVEGTADHPLMIQMYIDTRFGGLYPVLLA